ncbi:hypothetical protein ACFWUQ_30605 [Streptomyces sp. NPDC058662]|uniref:hypothetical protein n=1 Tax=Streptomyces sp. NPDC058662 TaxID=3346583 RepID=UPI00366471E6
MTGDSYNFGNVVNMHGGQGNTGMVNHHTAPAAPAADPGLERAIRELVVLIGELHAQLPPQSAQYLDESLPAITADPDVAPEARRRALVAVAGIAATVGAIGQPVLDSVRALLELLGA